MKSLFIFIDESGNFDFSPIGTKYFVLSAATTTNPLGKEMIEKIKYSLIKDGIDIEYFHAAEDRQFIRDKIYSVIENLDDIEVDSVIVQKNKANPSLYKADQKKKSKKGVKIYTLALRNLLQYIFRRYDNSLNIEKVIVVLSSIFDRNKRESIKKNDHPTYLAKRPLVSYQQGGTFKSNIILGFI
jgi:hypothetical protein